MREDDDDCDDKDEGGDDGDGDDDDELGKLIQCKGDNSERLGIDENERGGEVVKNGEVAKGEGNIEEYIRMMSV
ncbi:hypothetical protein BGZ76_007318 [Entomortierella beljakovae]|nr:hypothetical protein BGZ76_007318 [Entomortierella beljakovae]